MSIERLRSSHNISSFSCGHDDLDNWLHTAATTADRAGTARVYVDAANSQVAGYFAIVPHHVRRADVPSAVGRGGPEFIPGFLLARLALALDLQHSGRGGALLVRALEKMLEAVAIGGGRVIVVDAIDEQAASFYRHFGFTANPADPRRLVMKASTAAASLGIEWN